MAKKSTGKEAGEKRDRKAYQAAYYQARRDELRLKYREWARENREELLAKKERENRRAGHAPRERSSKNKNMLRVSVPKIRRYTVIDDRAYFNSELGYTREDLLAVLAEMKRVKREKNGG